MEEITCVVFVPDGRGGYRNYDDMTREEKARLSKSMVERIGVSINRYYSAHADEIRDIVGVSA